MPLATTPEQIYSTSATYFSSFLDDQRTQFLAERKAKKEGGQKGAAIKKLKASAVGGQPVGGPEGSLLQIPSSQVKSFSVNQEEELTDSKLDDHKEWLRDYNNTTTPSKPRSQE